MEKKVRTITITQYDYIIRNVNDEELDLQGHLHNQSEFDPAGNVLKEVRYSRQGDFEEMIAYEYDDHGNLAREAYYPAEDEMAEEKLFERDSHGILERIVKKYQDGSVDTTTCEYDENRRLIRKTTVNDEGEVEQVERFEWDQDRLVSYEAVDMDGDPLPGPEEVPADPERSNVTRNEKGLIIAEEELDEEGRAVMTIKRSYDENDRPVEVEVFVDGRGRTLTRHYFLRYSYTFFD
jgi:hypothetical protein